MIFNALAHFGGERSVHLVPDDFGMCLHVQHGGRPQWYYEHQSVNGSLYVLYEHFSGHFSGWSIKYLPLCQATLPTPFPCGRWLDPAGWVRGKTYLFSCSPSLAKRRVLHGTHLHLHLQLPRPCRLQSTVCSKSQFLDSRSTSGWDFPRFKQLETWNQINWASSAGCCHWQPCPRFQILKPWLQPQQYVMMTIDEPYKIYSWTKSDHWSYWIVSNHVSFARGPLCTGVRTWISWSWTSGCMRQAICCWSELSNWPCLTQHSDCLSNPFLGWS